MIGGNRMFHSRKFIFLIILSIVFLTACGQSREDRVEEGIKTAEETFFANDKKGTEEIEGVKLYKPMGFTVEENSDAQNIIFNKNGDMFILFVNPNEDLDSQLFYDLLLADESKVIVAKETFKEDDTFGFVAIVESDDDTVELVASVGGAKMTTRTNEKNIVKNIKPMMEIVRSIKY